MWDYDKLFAEGNVVGLKHSDENQIRPYIIYEQNDCMDYFNNSLSYNERDFTSQIQYIIRLDEHGNVVEKLFDRERDMKPEPKPMPELKTGMFIRVLISGLGFVDAEHNRVIYQAGYDSIYDEEEVPGIVPKIVEVYSEDACAFEYCDEDVLIWRDPDYQAYLDSKSN